MEKYQTYVCILDVFEKSSNVKTGSSITAALRPLNSLWHSSLQTRDLFFFNNEFSRVAIDKPAIVVRKSKE